jgi:hypothetical protein
VQGFKDWDGLGNLFLGQRTGDGDLMRRRFRVGCGCFFLEGRGRGRGVPGRVLLRSFRRTAGSKPPLFCVIYYMLSSGGFAAACLQAIVKGGSVICYMPVICLVIGGELGLGYMLFIAYLCNHILRQSGGGTWGTVLHTVRGVGSGSRDVDAWTQPSLYAEDRGTPSTDDPGASPVRLCLIGPDPQAEGFR